MERIGRAGGTTFTREGDGIHVHRHFEVTLLRQIESVSYNFSDMVTIGEKVEGGIRSGKLTHSFAEPINMWKGETNAIVTDQGKSHRIPNNSPSAIQSSQHQRSTKFDRIPVSYTDLFCHLVSHNLIAPRLMRPVKPPFPRRYDSRAKCEFLAGAVGHSTENCKPFKHVVQSLINTKQLSFKEDDDSLPENEESTIYAIGE